jgi:hypothetical protein
MCTRRLWGAQGSVRYKPVRGATDQRCMLPNVRLSVAGPHQALGAQAQMSYLRPGLLPPRSVHIPRACAARAGGNAELYAVCAWALGWHDA